MNRRNDLTVFIITCGEDVMDECLDAIRAQETEIPFRVELIQDVYPMSEAFNEMHRRARTPYFLQVDADMILKPHAIETLYQAIRGSWPWTYVSYGQLYEEGFGVGGTVRCWKKSFFKLFQFRDCRTVDRDLFRRARRFGFRRKNVRQVLGVHRPRHSSFSEYLKTKSDVEKWRFLGRPPEKYALPLLEELMNAPSENRFRLFGAVVGSLTSSSQVVHSKNIRRELEELEKRLVELNRSRLEEIELCFRQQDKEWLKKHFSKAYQGSANDQVEISNWLKESNHS